MNGNRSDLTLTNRDMGLSFIAVSSFATGCAFVFKGARSAQVVALTILSSLGIVLGLTLVMVLCIGLKDQIVGRVEPQPREITEADAADILRSWTNQFGNPPFPGYPFEWSRTENPGAVCKPGVNQILWFLRLKPADYSPVGQFDPPPQEYQKLIEKLRPSCPPGFTLMNIHPGSDHRGVTTIVFLLQLEGIFVTVPVNPVPAPL